MACTLYVLVKYRDKAGSPSIGSGQIKFRVLSGTAQQIQDQLEALLHTTADSSSLEVLPMSICYSLQ